MKKQKLKLLLAEQLPAVIETSQISDNQIAAYAFIAKNHVIESELILEVTFCSINKRIPQFRIFFNKQNFIVEKLGEHKWSESTLYNMENINFNNSICANAESRQIIQSFFNDFEHEPYEIMYSFQRSIRENQLKIKHKKIEDRIDYELRLVEELPDNLQEWVNNVAMSHSQYIYYRRNKKRVDGYCTVCGKDIEVAEARHNESGICPACGKAITFKAIGNSTKVADRGRFTYLQKYADGIMVRVFKVTKRYFDHYRNPDLSFWEVRRYIFNSSGMSPYYYGSFKNVKTRWCEGYAPVGMGNYYSSNDDYGDLYANNLKAVLEGTQWQYSQIEAFPEAGRKLDAATFLLRFNKHPEVEYLIRRKLFNLALYELDYGLSEDFARIVRQNLRLCQELDIKSDELYLCESLLKSRFKLKKEIFIWVREHDLIHSFNKIFKYCGPIKAMNYLNRERGNHTVKNTFQIWLDYIGFCQKLGYSLDASIILFPKELFKRHDEVAEELKAYEKLKAQQAIENENQSIMQMADELNTLYFYENNTFLIRAPINRDEIVKEGETLKHCVFSYTKKVAEKRTVILFVRDKKSPEKPFYTLELNNSKVQQCMGKNHCNMTADVKGFVDTWVRLKIDKPVEKAKKLKSHRRDSIVKKTELEAV